ncbi:caspase-8-like [Saccostrea echinata]|uniref:caspase-8-like n=1 Tax=Saccostrea echinata TaxID=191078 RepID=UPI002A8027BD|nr:caspase-8-like [Saccostrea echinata]
MPQSGDFRATLLDIDAHLDSNDLELLKFLCKDIVPFSVLDKCRRSLDVFVNLEQKGKLKEEDSIFLQECFHYMQRKDLIRKLGGDPQRLEKKIKADGPSQLTEFRILLFEISEDCGKDEFEAMKFYSRTTLQMTKKMLNNVTTCLSLFNVLEKEELLTPIQVKTMEQLIEATGDEELLDLLYKYKNKNLVACPSDEVPGMKLNSHISNHPDTTPVVPQEHQEPPHNLTALSEGPGLQMAAYPSLTSMNPPAQDAMDTLLSRQQSAAQSPQEDNEALESFSYYKMTSKPRGYCIIINNKIFHGQSDLRERAGTDIDEEKLEETFGTFLDFNVKIFRNCTCVQIREVCQKYSRKDHSQYDSIVVCILSHGTTGAVYGSDCQSVPIRDITSYFTASRCPTLADKPKLFFFQACQGLVHQSGLHNTRTTRIVNPGIQTDTQYEHPRSEEPPEEERSAPPRSVIPDESDFLLGYATVPGYVSYRSKSTGSFYINTLVEKLKKHALGQRSCDLMSILTEVNNAVSDLHYSDDQGGMYKQVPAPQFTLRRKVHFDKC